ncbi:Putative Fumarylacetoacetase [[Torrubiella] hemipterigena]|uniref:Fumarylacetoacetase n=1 Tax=[Torrubiella] hemipterigena TaxID=1531966 RepID=A0A0A1T835_9HYPO|nr:Putative Fumarylacetoacetase [[Torrubiella] hemipterigena]
MSLDASVKSWVAADARGDFSIHNLPFGIFSTGSGDARAGVRIGDHVVDLQALASDAASQPLTNIHANAALFGKSTLNEFAELGRAVHRGVRTELQSILAANTTHGAILRDNDALKQKVLIPADKVTMHLPMQIGDYTDFYAGYHHAFKVGVLFRGPENALQPNYTHLPVGYHGRSSSIVVSGTPIRRPKGQILTNPTAPVKEPVTSACKRLDYEVELGCFISRSTKMGDSVDVNEAENYVFGYVLLNDWSARDIQAWEYVPLGPFNGKNFGSTISPWIVTPDALEPFRTESLENTTPIQPYLQETQKKNVFDIQLEVGINAEGINNAVLAQTTGKNLLWSFSQMIAHHTLGGCPLRAGDMMGSGTISGTEIRQRGSLLEMTEGGKQDIEVGEGKVRRFIEDGDSVFMRGWCEKDGVRIGFGDCEGTIQPAN